MQESYVSLLLCLLAMAWKLAQRVMKNLGPPEAEFPLQKASQSQHFPAVLPLDRKKMDHVIQVTRPGKRLHFANWKDPPIFNGKIHELTGHVQ